MIDLKILYKTEILLNKKVKSIIAPAEDGELEILSFHEPMVVFLKKGELRYIEKGKERDKWQTVQIENGGFLKVETGSQVSVLLNYGWDKLE